MNLLVVGLGAGVMSLVMTWLLIKLATRYQIVDIANERSLHSEQTPRGGGLALVIVFVLFGAMSLQAEGVQTAELILYTAVVVASGGLGFIDDLFGLGVAIRLLCQLFIASVFAYLAFSLLPDIPAYGLMLLIVAFVWTVNATNFMDGADGLLSSQAALIFAMIAAILLLSDAETPGIIALLLASSCAGFLCLNWQPASIFLGDVGSYFIGAQIAVFAIYLPSIDISPYVVLILVTPLLADAAFTLVLRIASGNAFWRAHREHVYQRWILSGTSHRNTAVRLLLVHCFLFSPLALMCWKNPQYGSELFAIDLILVFSLWSILRFKVLRTQP